MPPPLLCDANEECDNVWVIQWLRRADFPPLLVVEAQDGRIVMPGSIAYRLLSQELNVVAVNEAGDGSSILKRLLIVAPKAETYTLHPLGHTAVEVKPDGITGGRTVVVSELMSGEEEARRGRTKQPGGIRPW